MADSEKAEGPAPQGEGAGAEATPQATPQAGDGAIAELQKGYKWIQGAYQKQVEANRELAAKVSQLTDLVDVLAKGVTDGGEPPGATEAEGGETLPETRRAKVSPVTARIEEAKQRHIQTSKEMSEAAQWFRQDIKTTLTKLGMSEAEVPGLEGFEMELAANPAQAWQKAKESIIDATAGRLKARQTLPVTPGKPNTAAIEPEIRGGGTPGGRPTLDSLLKKPLGWGMTQQELTEYNKQLAAAMKATK